MHRNGIAYNVYKLSTMSGYLEHWSRQYGKCKGL